MTYQTFDEDIKKMNEMYELGAVPPFLENMAERITNFRNILEQEVEEFDDIEQRLDELLLKSVNLEDISAGEIRSVQVLIADILGDIVVYCASEARRWGVPLSEVLRIIMASNFSKMGEDGKPIKDERGKFLKGPNYWKPEPYIDILLRGDPYITNLIKTGLPFKDAIDGKAPLGQIQNPQE